MRMRLRSAALGIAALASLVACGPPPPASPPDVSSALDAAPDSKTTSTKTPAPDQSPAGDFRKSAPPPGPPVVFVPPKIQEERLPNGIRVLLVERHELPVVAVEIGVDRGADQTAPGVAAFATAMLLQGTKTRSALALSDEFGKLGVTFGAGADYDSAGIGARGLSTKLPEMLALLGDVVKNPAFDEAEIKREKSKRLMSILQQNDRPATLLGNMVAASLYPAAHPYSAPLIGTEQEVTRITAADLKRFHADHFQPDRLTIAVAGDVTKARAVEEIQRVFGAFQGKAQPAKEAAEPPPPDPKGTRIFLLDRPGATQSHVSVAQTGVPRLTKDYDALLVMNTILGGQFTSRLNLNLREKHAYTYGARSGFDMRHGPGPFSAGGAIHRASTAAAVTELLSEIDRIQRELVTPEELAGAQSTLILQLPARFETASDTASTLLSLSIFGLPLDEFATRPARLQRVTREDVKRVAEKVLTPDRLRVFVVGDAAAVKDQLSKLNLGAVEVKQPLGAAEPKQPLGAVEPKQPPGKK